MKTKRKGNLDKVARDKKTGQFKKLRKNAKPASDDNMKYIQRARESVKMLLKE